LFDDYCRRTGGNNALLIICDQLEAQDRFQSMASSLLRRKRFGKIGDDAKTGKMLGRMDPSKCYPNCTTLHFNQDVKGEADGSRTFLQLS
jgi:hypothetical protein